MAFLKGFRLRAGQAQEEDRRKQQGRPPYHSQLHSVILSPYRSSAPYPFYYKGTRPFPQHVSAPSGVFHPAWKKKEQIRPYSHFSFKGNGSRMNLWVVPEDEWRFS